MKVNYVSSAMLPPAILSTMLVIILLMLATSCKKNIQQEASDSLHTGVIDMPENGHAVDLKLIADNFVSPIGVVAVPGKQKHEEEEHDADKKSRDQRLFVIDQIGKIWIIDENGNRLPVPFIDMVSKMVTLNPGYDERGLLGFAFHPNYKSNGRFYVYYTAPRRTGGPQPGLLWNNLSVVSEFKVSQSNPNMADMSTERRLLEIDDPQSNHNGGTLSFGPDEMLYISIGDGGGANDVGPGHVQDWYAANAGGNGQDIEANLFGNILRIDVDHGNPYSIPGDNPFVGKPGKDEIYAYGFRNPFRFSFDMGGSRRLIAGDAGQLLYEEIDVVKKGGNYGWNVKEGRHCFNAANSLMEMPSCPAVDNFGNPLIDPVIELNNWRNPKGGKATTVVGGNVYRGHSIPQFEGKYIFGTFSQNISTPNGELFIANPAGNDSWSFQEVVLKSFPNDLSHYLKGFGQDNKGEVYVTVSKVLGPAGITGKVYKLVAEKNQNDKDDDD